MSRLLRIQSISSCYNGRLYFKRNNKHGIVITSFQNRPTFGIESKAESILSGSPSVKKASFRFLTGGGHIQQGDNNDNKNKINLKGNESGGSSESFRSIDETTKEKKLESIVTELLTKQKILEKPIFLAENNVSKDEDELVCVVHEYDDSTLKNAAKAIEYYSSEKRPRFNLNKGEQKDDKNGLKCRNFFLPGSHLCHTILTTAILPKSDMIISEKQATSVIELFLLTIKSFSHSSKKKGYWQQQHKNSANLLENGTLSEGLLRLLLSTKVSYHDSDLSNPEKKSAGVRKLLFCYNATLDNWAKIAANVNLTSSPNASSVSRDAALKAEQLLLEMALARSQYQNESGFHDQKTRKNQLESLLSCVKPDVVSFNTVITAWSETARVSSTRRMKFKSSGINTNSAAERAQAILKLMQDLSDEVPFLKNHNYNDEKVIRPDRRSYDAVIQAWSNSSSPDARNRVLEILNDMMNRYDAYDIEINKRNNKRNKDMSQAHIAPPFPTAVTLSSIFSSLARSRDPNIFTDTDAEALLSQTRKWYNNRGLIWKPDTIVYNSLLAVVCREALNKRNSLESMRNTCCRIDEIIEDMVNLSAKRFAFCEPDSVTYGVAISSWTSLSKEASSKMKGKYTNKNKKLAIECANKAEEYLNKIYLLESSEKEHRELRRQERHCIPSTRNINDTIKAFCVTGEPQKGEEILRKALSHFPRIKLNTNSYSLLINGFINLSCSGGKKSRLIKEDDVDRARQLLEEMEQMICEDKIMVNNSITTIYNEVIDAYARLGKFEDLKKAEDILSRMMQSQSSNLPQQSSNSTFNKEDSNTKYSIAKPNTFSFATILSAYGRLCVSPSSELNIYSQRAQTLLRGMEMIYNKRRTEIDVTKSNKLDPHVTPNVIIYNILLNILAKQSRFAQSISEKENHLKNCENLLQHMENLGALGVNNYVTPDKYSYGILVSAIADSNLSDAGSRAKTILAKITNNLIERQARSPKDVKKTMVDTTLLNTILKALKNSPEQSSCDDALEILKKMEDGYFIDFDILPVYPDKFSYCTVIAKLAKLGTLEAALKALKLLSNLDNHFNAIKSGQKQLMENERLDLLEPDTKCYNAVLSAFANVGTEEAASRAEKLLEKMEQLHQDGNSRVKPDLMSFRTVIKGWIKCRNANRANEILGHMETLYEAGYKGIEPDAETKKVVAQALARKRKKSR